MKIIAIYSGTFDPITLGHEDILKRASLFFDTLIVAVAQNTQKKTLFSYEERIDLCKKVCASYNNVQVHGFSGLLGDFASQMNASVIIRGLRNGIDFDYETQMATANRTLVKGLETFFIPSLDQTRFISGSLVREIWSLQGDISHFVNPFVLKALEKKAQQ